MGIVGLLPLLKSITRDVHISEYKGMKVAVDAHGWLHRAIYSCGTFDIRTYTDYCTNLIQLLLRNDIRPIVVFDGKSLPAKSITSLKRKDLRDQYAAKAKESERYGFFADAEKYYKKTIVVTDEFVSAFIDALRDLSVDYVVSPYEADAQLAYLSLTGVADVVITEDSDALVYGCQRVLFKLDCSGNGKEILRSDLGKNTQLSFQNWTDEQFKLFCCLSGCDYVPKLPNIGIKTAHRIASAHKNFMEVLKYLRKMRKECDFDYFMQLARGLLTFSHQTVLDPCSGSLRPLIPLDMSEAEIVGTTLNFLCCTQLNDSPENTFMSNNVSGVCGVSLRRSAGLPVDADLAFLGPIWHTRSIPDDASSCGQNCNENVCSPSDNIVIITKEIAPFDSKIVSEVSPSKVPVLSIYPCESADAGTGNDAPSVSMDMRISKMKRKRQNIRDCATLCQVLNNREISPPILNISDEGYRSEELDSNQSDDAPAIFSSEDRPTKRLKRNQSLNYSCHLYPSKYMEQYIGSASPVETLYRRKRRLDGPIHSDLAASLSLTTRHIVNKSPSAQRRSTCLESALQFLNLPSYTSAVPAKAPAFSVRYTDFPNEKTYSSMESTFNKVCADKRCLKDNETHDVALPFESETQTEHCDGDFVFCNLPWLTTESSSCDNQRAGGIIQSCERIQGKPEKNVKKNLSMRSVLNGGSKRPPLFKSALLLRGKESCCRSTTSSGDVAEMYWDRALTR